MRSYHETNHRRTVLPSLTARHHSPRPQTLKYPHVWWFTKNRWYGLCQTNEILRINLENWRLVLSGSRSIQWTKVRLRIWHLVPWNYFLLVTRRKKNLSNEYQEHGPCLLAQFSFLGLTQYSPRKGIHSTSQENAHERSPRQIFLKISSLNAWIYQNLKGFPES